MLPSIDAQILLRRFCYLGCFECVFQHHGWKAVDVSGCQAQIKQLCNSLEHAAAEQLLRAVLLQGNPVRYDEALFVYVCYLDSEVAPACKLALRQAFSNLVVSDEHMFLFCKYAKLLRSVQKLHGISTTVRKALISWYKAKTPLQLRQLLLQKRGAHGITHKSVMQMCHVSDVTLGANIIYKQATQKYSELPTVEPTTAVVLENGVNHVAAKQADGKRHEELSNMWSGICRLHVTQSQEEALALIKKHQLKYAQLPEQWKRNAAVLSLVAASMKFWELLQHWRVIVQKEQDKDANAELLRILQKQLLQRNIIRNADVHPVMLLMKFQGLGVRSDYKMLRRGDNVKVPFLRELYVKCYGKNHNIGLRMHFVLNLQESYKKKLLKHCHKVSYYHAAIALAFGYFKKENSVDVYYWGSDKYQLLEVPWRKEMTINNAISVCDNIMNNKNSQLLTVPISRALRLKQVYDVFVAVVPTAGRGNPNNSSEQLCQELDKYRATINSTAKYVIVDLLRYRKSMQYSNNRSEHMLEICGIDEHTSNLINDFALGRFE